jgi:hypothetical protein
MTDPCINCGERPASREGGWMLCEPCWQDQCWQEEQARAEVYRVDSVLVRRVLSVPTDLLLSVVRPRVPSLRLERGHWRGDCPWCDEDGELSESFFVYPANYYHCFACGAHGDAIQFLMVDEELGFMQAVEWLARERGLQ